MRLCRKLTTWYAVLLIFLRHMNRSKLLKTTCQFRCVQVTTYGVKVEPFSGNKLWLLGVGGIEKLVHIQRKTRRLVRCPGVVALKGIVANFNPEKGRLKGTWSHLQSDKVLKEGEFDLALWAQRREPESVGKGFREVDLSPIEGRLF